MQNTAKASAQRVYSVFAAIENDRLCQGSLDSDSQVRGQPAFRIDKAADAGIAYPRDGNAVFDGSEYNRLKALRMLAIVEPAVVGQIDDEISPLAPSRRRAQHPSDKRGIDVLEADRRDEPRPRAGQLEYSQRSRVAGVSG